MLSEDLVHETFVAEPLVSPSLIYPHIDQDRFVSVILQSCRQSLYETGGAELADVLHYDAYDTGLAYPQSLGYGIGNISVFFDGIEYLLTGNGAHLVPSVYDIRYGGYGNPALFSYLSDSYHLIPLTRIVNRFTDYTPADNENAIWKGYVLTI